MKQYRDIQIKISIMDFVNPQTEEYVFLIALGVIAVGAVCLIRKFCNCCC